MYPLPHPAIGRWKERHSKATSTRKWLALETVYYIHTLFDRGLISLAVGEDGVQVNIADALKESEYGELDGRLLRAPTHESFAPDPAAIEKRNGSAQ